MEKKQPQPTQPESGQHATAPQKMRKLHWPRTYRAFEQLMSRALGINVMVFLIYLMAASRGVGWLKGILAVVALLGAALSLGFMFLNRELNRPRSRWMVAGFGAIVVCLLVSLLFRYPSPVPTAEDINAPAVSITAENAQNETEAQTQ